MSVTRRQFLRAGGSTAVVMGTGCDRLATVGLGSLGGSALEAIRPPAHDEIDLERHVLNRLSFGVRPGEYARVREMGVEAYIEEQLHPETIEDGRAARAVLRARGASAGRVAATLPLHGPVRCFVLHCTFSAGTQRRCPGLTASSSSPNWFVTWASVPENCGCPGRSRRP